ncbi:TPA: hypothetical protein TVN81_001247 [Streptococcus equi subsp. zooepidemicus]|uniref:hypothetical protein n=1 Tax=Streptococcus equi TaxID=1336 RepID=UPI001E3DFF7D|nr:hypothetical protein [Streptococcus equi]MCD3455878.1 hypothetical protein [Streptococcus equi subsp. zooepidemicus]HEL0007764.1 hypothetical protein [Streptococcus equi subsp. zooepidemicus]HEL0114909.1 hypothetical protein [Streptococcus equi subsp. zooepidemicus]HEL0148712.1 hypothetical protein [Streptococcus equi subsp. zooepidemicus]HEL0184925.1 hypothetical protein [Streptococcus equi subsp. zooepidemicus]
MSAKPSVALPILWFTKHRDKAVTFIKNFLISLEHDQSHHDKIRRLMIELKKKKKRNYGGELSKTYSQPASVMLRFFGGILEK